jgi:hypothetical protein
MTSDETTATLRTQPRRVDRGSESPADQIGTDGKRLPSIASADDPSWREIGAIVPAVPEILCILEIDEPTE